MVLKDANLLLLVLSVSQVFATSLLHPRSHEILQSRQYGCSSCTTAANTFSNCRSIECICNLGFVADLQSCFNCAIAANPSPDVVSPIRKVLDDYARTCPDVPRVTIPPVTTGTSSQTGTGINISTTSSSVSQSGGGPGTTGTAAGANTVPTTTTKSSASKGMQAGFAAICAMVGAALVL